MECNNVLYKLKVLSTHVSKQNMEAFSYTKISQMIKNNTFIVIDSYFNKAIVWCDKEGAKCKKITFWLRYNRMKNLLNTKIQRMEQD